MKPGFLKFFAFQNILILVLATGTAIRHYFTTSIGKNIVLHIKSDLFAHAIHLSPVYFETKKTGNILSQIQNDTLIIENLIGNNMSVAFRNLIMLIGGLSMLILSSKKLTFFIIVLIPIIIIPIILLGKQIKKLSKESQVQQGLLTSACEESINSVKTIQANCSEEHEINKHNISLKASLLTSLKVAKLKSLLIFTVIFLIFCGVGLILWYGGCRVVRGYMSIGDLSSFVFLAVICAGSISGLSETFGEIIKASAACERSAEFLNLKSKIITSDNSIDLSNDPFKKVQFKKVYFSYPSKKSTPALSNLSFTAKAGDKIAIVGKSGAGKSTVLQLLMRFYDIDSGEISLNDTSIKDITLPSLRRKFAYISQNPVIFSTTIYNNILFSNPNASYEDVINAAKTAVVDEFALKFSDKYDTFIGEKGMRLSGGQKQRISLARAILKNSEILLLDEATSSLDYKNENLIQKAINYVSQNKLSITVAHRLSTVINADRILVFDAGKLVEKGTHKELIDKKGVYFDLINANTSTGIYTT
jgi:ATP-binding cassette subfamily B protein